MRRRAEMARAGGREITDLLYVSEKKIRGRLGMWGVHEEGEFKGSAKFPGVIDFSATKSWQQDPDGLASHELVRRAAIKVEQTLSPVDFTQPGLLANQWVRFQLPMAQAAVHEDSSEPPEDVALFIGSAPTEFQGETREIDLMLCGSAYHLRGRTIPAGRMGSDTTWLHDLILAVEEREENGVNVIPEFLTEILPTRKSQNLIGETARGVFNWISRDLPPSARGSVRGYAIVLMDIECTPVSNRLIVATPLYVESSPVLLPSRPRRSIWRQGR
ncbi:SAVMC3_10250 family protein [Actinacidiphila guanduensis]|uniref:Uncharacterized protein n=1 Tax=Actinacidiphila guanduensis TaxID=310781 RepID=A0A1G9XU50_9ACTN|nr:SAVMC3_10250 family protein [Actinacidiphila guanduensis]SDM99763.1 hypothetical protein SAMN05216259_102262 [Actinacidiphila guanduensis]